MSETTPKPGRAADMKLREFCERIGVSYRDARYALDQGVVPKGIDADPGRGNHRLFDGSQAFYLGLVIKLKAAGIKTPVAAKIAELAKVVQGKAVNGGWDWQFAPFIGEFKTDKQWFLEVAEGCIRIGTTANPDKNGKIDLTPWTHIATRKSAGHIEAPVVMIRVDLSALAARLV